MPTIKIDMDEDGDLFVHTEDHGRVGVQLEDDGDVYLMFEPDRGGYFNFRLIEAQALAYMLLSRASRGKSTDGEDDIVLGPKMRLSGGAPTRSRMVNGVYKPLPLEPAHGGEEEASE